ncbi:MAG: FHA domain-containing protein [Pirellulaceae bacterium]
MITATLDPIFTYGLLGDATGSLALRVHGTEHDGRVLHIYSPKCLIGSDPSCTLRLRAATVRPFHCLILRGTDGTFIRRWSPDTCLNGARFDDARLCPGDRISIGAIELEVLPPPPQADVAPPIEPPTENDAVNAPATGNEAVSEPLVSSVEAAPIRPADHEESQSLSPAALRDDAGDVATWKEIAERLRRELQQTRDEHRQVCEEWHMDRQSLESELNARTTAAQQLEQKYKQEMREAEVLIHAMQQEGKHLLVQLEEVKQSVRQSADGQHKKRPAQTSAARPVASLGVPAGTASAPGALAGPQSPIPSPRPQSVCSTMLMGSQLAVGEPASPPAACEVQALESRVPTLVAGSVRLSQTVDSIAESPASGAPSEVVAAPHPTEDFAPTESTDAVGGQEPEDDECVIQRYMERLLRRVGRVGAEEDTPTHMVAALQAVTPPLAQAMEPGTARTGAQSNSSSKSNCKTDTDMGEDFVPTIGDALHDHGHVGERRTKPVSESNHRVKPREVIPPGLAADLRAMRELANGTARRELILKNLQRNRAAALRQIAVALVCLVTGMLASALSPTYLSAQTLAGSLGMSFGIVFLMRGLHTYFRLRAETFEAQKEAGS